MERLQSPAPAVKNRLFCVFLTEMEKDVRPRLKTFSIPGNWLHLLAHIANASKCIPVGWQVYTSMKCARLNVQPPEMKAEAGEGAKTGGGGSKQAWSKTRYGIKETEKGEEKIENFAISPGPNKFITWKIYFCLRNGVCGGGGQRTESKRNSQRWQGWKKREKVTDRSETNVRKAPRVD